MTRSRTKISEVHRKLAIVRNKTWPRDDHGYLKAMPLAANKRRHWNGAEWIVTEKPDKNKERLTKYWRKAL